MATKKVIFQVEVIGTESQVKKLNDLEKELYDITKARNTLITKQRSGVNLDKEEEAELIRLKQRTAELSNSKAKLNQDIQRTINAGRNNINTLRGVNAELAIQKQKIQDVVIGSKEYHQIGRRIKELETQQRKFNQEVGRGSTFVGEYARGFRTAFVQVGAAVTGVVMLISQLNRIFGKSIKDFKEWEQGLVNVQTLLFEGQDVTLEERATRLAKEHGLEIKELTKAYFDAVSAGNSVAESEVLLNQASILAKAGVTSLAVATDGMTSVLNAYQLSMDDAERVASAFFTAQKFGKTTVEELAAEIGVVAPIARQAGMSFQELLSAFAELTKQGIRTPEAGTAIKNLIIAMIKPSEQAKEAMDSLGIAYGATAIRQQGFFNILTKVSQAGEENADVIAQIIPNIRALTGMGALGSEALKEYEHILSVVNKDYGEGSSLMKGYAAQMETSMEKGKIFAANMRLVRIEIGEKLSPALGAVKSIIMAVANWFAKNIDVIISLGTVLVKLTGLWIAYKGIMVLVNSAKLAGIAVTKSLTAAEVIEGSTMKANTAITGAFIAIKKAYLASTTAQTAATKVATIAQKAWNMVIKANPIGLMVTAIGALVTILTLLPKKLSAVEKVQQELNEIELNATLGVVDQQYEIAKLVKVIDSETASKKDKLDAQKKLIEISDGYLDTITEETIASGEAKIAIDKYISSLKEKARIQAIEARIREIQTEKIKAEAGEGMEASAWQKGINAVLTYGNIQSRLAQDTKTFFKNRQEQLEYLTQQEIYYQAQLTGAIEATAATGEDVQNNYKKELADLKNANNEALKGTAEYIRRQIELEKKAYLDKVAEYETEVEDDLTRQTLIEEARKNHHRKLEELQSQLAEKLRATNEKIAKSEKLLGQTLDIRTLAAISEDIYSQSIDNLKKAIDEELKLEGQRWADVQKTYADNHEALELAEQVHWERMREIRKAGEFTEAFAKPFEMEEETPVEEPEVDAIVQAEEAKLLLIQSYQDKGIEALQGSLSRRKEIIEQWYAAGIISEEQYNAGLAAISTIGAKKREAIITASLQGMVQVFGEASKIGRAAVIAEKAYAVAESLIAIFKGTAKSAAAAPFPANLGLIAGFITSVAGLIASIKAVKVPEIESPKVRVSKFAEGKAPIVDRIFNQKTEKGEIVQDKTFINRIFRRKTEKGEIVQGTGKKDTIPALLTPGEAVVVEKAMASSDVITTTGTPRQIASEINAMYGGIRFAEGKAPVITAPAPVVIRGQSSQITRDLIREIVAETVSGVTHIPVIVTERDITGKQRMARMVETQGDF